MMGQFFPQRRKGAKLIFVVVLFLCIFAPLRETSSRVSAQAPDRVRRVAHAFAAIPNGKNIFKEVAAGDIRTKPFDLNGGWVPWYTLHKLFAGLLDADRYTRNTKALSIAVKLADWADATVANLNEEQFQRMLACEHGGMNEALAELYARTSQEKYLKLSRRFHHKAVLESLARREDRLQGLHANTQIPKLIGLARRYELTGDAADKTAAEFFWDRVVHHSREKQDHSSFSGKAQQHRGRAVWSKNSQQRLIRELSKGRCF